ncbi:TrmH family RNA methyltransferase [Orenia metallireducens]|uniref:RNA methyltransferase, TrmH family n=1 Tax=Orenia metallireducens TaxID=1413210 RepID=A0A285I3S6_9FIRM|nr:TrmH family RNA methyltransferase [Orenia metallireducens]PRX23137.1 TrmH family RNA methyltransferase [Orenia metallireducens]SNY42553.1 RNA methyltransferase, TrmH family [Orenia metallireducens]
MRTLTKLKDPLIQEARELSKIKNRIIKNKIQLRGLEQIKWAKDAGLEIKSIFISKNEDPTNYEQFSAPIYQTSNGILKKITETNYLIPAVGVAEPLADKEEFGEFVLLLDDINDHGNIGTIIRTGRAYGINDFITTNADFDPYIPKTIDASRGTSFKVNFKRYSSPEQAVSYLKEQGYQIIATSPHGKSLQSTVDLDKKPIALVVGNETLGVSDEVIKAADHIVQIPMYTGVESLNVGVATGISIYELRLKEVLTMLAEKIISTLGREINVTSKLIRQAFNIKLKEISEFSGDQIIFLMVLKRKSLMNEEQIKEQFGYFGDRFKEFINPLYEDNLIKKEYEEIAITKEGEELLAKLWPVHEKAENLILQGFTEEEKKELKKYLEKIQHNCMQIITYKA